jgi:hypothetical protein
MEQCSLLQRKINNRVASNPSLKGLKTGIRASGEKRRENMREEK